MEFSESFFNSICDFFLRQMELIKTEGDLVLDTVAEELHLAVLEDKADLLMEGAGEILVFQLLLRDRLPVQ